MKRGIFPTTDNGLLAWSGNFSTKISATPEAYGLDAVRAAAYAAIHQSFETKLAAVDPGVRNKVAVSQKNDVRNSLKNSARSLALAIQGSSVTDAQKLDLGLTVRKQPTPIGVPTSSPGLEVGGRLGTTVILYLTNPTGPRRAKPDGVQGARIYSFIGPVAPVSVDEWVFEGQVTRSEAHITFPASTAPGTLVWFTAQWYNPRGETGPGSTPISTNIAGGAVLEAA